VITNGFGAAAAVVAGTTEPIAASTATARSRDRRDGRDGRTAYLREHGEGRGRTVPRLSLSHGTPEHSPASADPERSRGLRRPAGCR
jgi:hypothetical protein